MNASTTVIGAHHNGGLLFILKNQQKVVTYTSCGVAEEKECDIQTESIATAELGGCRILEISSRYVVKRNSLGGMEYVMDESTRQNGMVFCLIFRNLCKQTYAAIIHCISFLYSARFDCMYIRNW